MPELTAYHEAGHALMAVLLGGKVKHVRVVSPSPAERTDFGNAETVIDDATARFPNTL